MSDLLKAELIGAVIIIFALGGLELMLFWIGQKEAKEQTKLLEDIAVSLSLREQNEPSGND